MIRNVESDAKYIADLNESFPLGEADVNRLDDHIRLIKKVLKFKLN